MADSTVGQIIYDAVINTAEFKKGAKELDAAAQNTGTEVEKSMGKTESAVRDAGRAVGAGLATAGVGLTAFAKSSTDFTVDYVRDVKKISRETGTTTEETSRLLYVFKRMGIETETASAMFGLFSKKLVEASSKTGENQIETEKLNISIAKTKQQLAATQAEIAKNGDKTGALSIKVRDLNNDLQSMNAKLSESAGPFAKLGISTVDAAGKQKAFGAVLLEVADKFESMPNGAAKTAAALELFGRQGKDLIPVLNQGSDGILELQKNADRLGLTITSETVASIGKYIESQKDLKDSTDAVKIAVGQLTAPILTTFNQKINDTILSLTASESPFKQVTANILAFGGPVSTAAGGLASFGANIGGATEAAGGFSKLLQVIGKGFGWITVVVLAGAALYYLETRFGIFSETWDRLQPKLQLFYDFMVANVLPVLQTLGGFILGQLTSAWNDFRAAIQNIMTTLAPYQNQLELIGKILLGVVAVAISAVVIQFLVVVGVITAVLVIGARLIGWLAQAEAYLFRLASSGISAMHSFAQSIAHGIGTAINWFQALPGRVTGALGNMGSLLYGIGQDIIQGMINGIKARIGGVTSAVSDAANAVKNTFKSILGIRSPSKVFALYGKNIVQGLSQGIDNNSSMASRSIGNMIGDLDTGLSAPNVGVSAMNSIESSGGGSGSAPVVQVNMNGIMARSRSDLRDIGTELVKLVNEGLQAKGQPVIGGGKL